MNRDNSQPDTCLVCANCGNQNVRSFCPDCGQELKEPPSTLISFVRYFWDDVASLDSILLRSFALLIAKPGRLCNEYLAGHRIRYSAPQRLFLIASALFFIVNALNPIVVYNPETAVLTSRLGGAEANFSLINLGNDNREIRNERAEKIRSAAIGYFPILQNVSVILFSLVLALFYRKLRLTFMVHALFSMHWSAFYMVIMTVDRLLSRWIPHGFLGFFVILISFVYMTIALKTVYGGSVIKNVFIAVFLNTIYSIILGIWMVSAIAMAFLIG